MNDDREILLSQEQATVSLETAETGRVRAVKRTTTEPTTQTVSRGVEHAELETGPVLEGDSGEVLTLPDGSVSIPVFEEQIVVTKRLVVRERVVLRKHTVYEDHRVTADLRKEQLDIETTGDVRLADAEPGSAG